MIISNPPGHSQPFSGIVESQYTGIMDHFCKMGGWELRRVMGPCAYRAYRSCACILSTILPCSQKLKKVWDNGSLPLWFVWEGVGMTGRIG